MKIKLIDLSVLILVALVTPSSYLVISSEQTEPLETATVEEQLRAGKVGRIVVEGDERHITFTNGDGPRRAVREPGVGLLEYFEPMGSTPEQLASASIEWKPAPNKATRAEHGPAASYARCGWIPFSGTGLARVGSAFQYRLVT